VRYITLSFTINGEQRYKTGRNDALEVGEELTAWYDPDDPVNEKVFIEDYDDFGGGFSLIGLLPIALGAGLLIYAFKSGRKKGRKLPPLKKDDKNVLFTMRYEIG
jgi:hypothetical protein